MATKVSVLDMLAYYAPHAVRTEGKAPESPPANQWGYVLGAQGETATVGSINALAKELFPGSWQSYAARCAKWIGRPVFDCNSLAEVFYRKQTGTNIDTRARNNYASWCNPKSPSAPDKTLSGLPQMPGVAVFIGNSAASITHVGFLAEKYGSGDLDWYVLEARGANYGVVFTRLQGRGWQWWGVMDKYFQYGSNQSAPAAPAPAPSSEPFFAQCSGGSVNVRAGRGTHNAIIGVLNKGDKMLALPAQSGWCEVSCIYKGKMICGFMSATYVKEAGKA